jgi:GH15 family glucan-1,4-alpha-glucosidase
MSRPVEDYALIGNLRTAALVSRDCSIDWLCLPRFDSPACFARLLGGTDHGNWRIAPVRGCTTIRRRYHGDTLVLETEFETEEGVAIVTDLMPVAAREGRTDVIRIVRGVSGTVTMRSELTLRFEYGRIRPWLSYKSSGMSAIAAPHALIFSAPMTIRDADSTAVADFTVSPGQTLTFTLTVYPSHEPQPDPPNAERTLQETADWWSAWSRRCNYQGPWREAVMRSLIVIKALSYPPTGGIVAAATTSLPETLGGNRNWDYRLCWPRDATFTFYALHFCGYREEALSLLEWLFRAAAGHPAEMQTVYGLSGERLLFESELPWLMGYENAVPVRIGNSAFTQFQLDIFGEIVDSLYAAGKYNLELSIQTWDLQKAIISFLETAWKQPDNGIWEIRDERHHFTHSKLMAWVAVDRAVRSIEQGSPGPLDSWRHLRAAIRNDICVHGFNPRRNAFVQSYGSETLDASLLMIPMVGFLPADDPRVTATVSSIQRELSHDGFVFRNPQCGNIPPEGAFLPCTFWLADYLSLAGREQEAHELFERALSVRNDLGLLSEEYDITRSRLVGNFPQVLSHVSLINTAHNLMLETGPAAHRSKP